MTTTNQPPRKLLDQLSDQLRTKHYSLRTEKTYTTWVRRFILFHNKKHPLSMGAPEINAFISHLALQGKVAASTQKQALSSIVFLYRYVLNVELDQTILNAVRPRRPKRIPTVLSKQEAKKVIDQMDGLFRLLTQILYGSGLRLTPALAP